MRSRAPVAVALASLVALFVVGCGPKAAEGTTTATLDVGGRTRSYAYHLPPQHTPQKKWPLVLALHGRLGTGVGQEKLSALSSIADRDGAIVVYPDGFERSWNDHRGVGPAADAKVDDVGFLGALIDTFVRDYGADDKRVFVTGMSNGAMMSFRAACELSDKVAAFGAVAGLFPRSGVDACKPKRALPVMIVAGTDDKLVPYNGGEVANDRGAVLSAAQTRDYFATKNQCGLPREPRWEDGVEDGTRVGVQEVADCRPSGEVVLVTVEGGGHTWPGGWQYLPEVLVGKTSRDADASEMLWSFFQRHPMP